MKITFFSNFLNHHQLPFCQELIKCKNVDFKFVATEKIPEDRLKLGYEDINSKYDFVVKAYENEQEAYKLGLESDVVIIGSSPDKYIKKRFKSGKITFRYSERLFKSGKFSVGELKLWFNTLFSKVFLERNTYLLCASAFSTRDYNFSLAYINKCYKWGYFPEIKKYSDINKIINSKDPVSILWAGRFIDFKHPETVIQLARNLKNEKINFNINMIGAGELEHDIKSLIIENNLSDCVKLLGSMPPNEVRKYMEKSNIFLFTSDKGEGWGAVLNESMNSGCAVVASDQIGAVPFLIQDNVNGIIYKNGDIDNLTDKVINLLNDKKLSAKLGKGAYLSMVNEWNPATAANRLIELIDSIKSNKKLKFTSGPCSKAQFLKENWYKKNNS